MSADRWILKALKAGGTMTVRSKNGDCIPFFSWRPEAYRCSIGKRRVPPKVAENLINRRFVVCINRGWYNVGHFQFNRDLRDERGRFKKRAESASENSKGE